MADKISIFSQNCQGLANPQKRRAVFRHVRLKKYNKGYRNHILKQSWGIIFILVVLIIAVGE